MKISNSKKELARIISENGGWRNGAGWSVFGKKSMAVVFVDESNKKPIYDVIEKAWPAIINSIVGEFSCSPFPNWHQTALASAEYLHLYPAQDADGWIEWKGGECPVEKGTLVDVIWRDGRERTGVKALQLGGAGHQFWVADGMVNDIIAYRLHKRDAVKPTDFGAVGDDETNLSANEELETMEYKPSIEQLMQTYTDRAHSVQLANEHLATCTEQANEAKEALSVVCKAAGFDISPITAKQEPELAITDWRDLQTGDLVWVEEEGGRVAEGEYEVLEVEVPDYDGKRTIRIRGGEGGQFWINYENGWRFIRRP